MNKLSIFVFKQIFLIYYIYIINHSKIKIYNTNEQNNILILKFKFELRLKAHYNKNKVCIYTIYS
jgi:hypothetical protein